MKSIYENLLMELGIAREGGDKEAMKTYQYVIGEVGRQKNKDLSNDAVAPIVRGCLKKTQEALEAGSATVDEVHILQGFIDAYLPASLTPAQITTIVHKAIDEGATNVGQVMKYVKEAAQTLGVHVELAYASEIARSALL